MKQIIIGYPNHKTTPSAPSHGVQGVFFYLMDNHLMKG